MKMENLYRLQQTNKLTKCNTKMKKLTNIQSIRFSDEQIKSLQILKAHNVVVSRFIRQAVKEKIQRDWKNIKESKNREYCPF